MMEQHGHRHDDPTRHEHHEHVAERACDGAGHTHHDHADGSCCCEVHAKEFHGIDRPMLIRLILAAICYLAGMLLPVGDWGELLLMLVSALLSGYEIILRAIRNLSRGQLFDEYFLMTFAAVAAFVIGEAEEGAAVFLLFCIGSFCQNYAIRHSRSAIKRFTGEEHDGEVGEVSNRFISRFARVYTPVVLLLAVLIAVLLPILKIAEWKDAIYRSLTFLVVACPCAIVISVPLAYFAGIRSASRYGIYFSGSEALDAAAAQTSPEIDPVETDGVQQYAVKILPDQPHVLFMDHEEDYAIAHRIAVKTRKMASENIWFTILIKASVLILSAFGVSALWFAVFADSGVTVLVVLNALRAFHLKK